MKKTTTFLLLLCIILISGAACGNSTPKHEGYIVDKNNLFGIVEPLWEKGNPNSEGNFQVKGFNLEKTVKLMGALGAKSYRMWFPTSIFTQSVTDYYKDALSLFEEEGFNQIIGIAVIFPAISEFTPDSGNSVPKRSDSFYGKWLNEVSTLWERLAATFPEIKYWELGNEFNMSAFMHPNGFIPTDGNLLGSGQGGFSKAELVKLNLDYMYYASAGVKKANPDAVTIMPGYSNGGSMTSREVEYFISDIYTEMKTGEYPFGEVKSKNSDDYFMCLGWHPYVLEGRLDEDWLVKNNDIYKVAEKNGDKGKKVFFTEFGFTDFGDEGMEDTQIGFMDTALKYAKEDMPYLEGFYAFRLYECAFAEVWGGLGEVHFGYFKEPDGEKGFSPKKKAFALQEIYGGTGDLRMFE